MSIKVILAFSNCIFSEARYDDANGVRSGWIGVHEKVRKGVRQEY